MIENLTDFNEIFKGDSLKKSRRYYYLLNLGTVGYIKKKEYREVHVKKSGGGTRILNVPKSNLKNLQRMLFTYLNYGSVSSYSSAYKKGCSLLKHANQHLGKQLLLKLDINDFFGSISFGEVYSAIHVALDNCPDICGDHKALSYYFSQFCTLGGSLPQGAPTSPLLSNMIFFQMDEKIGSYCSEKNISYTRYSDDLIFSGNFSPSSLISFVKKLLSNSGYYLNGKKTVIAGSGKRQQVTGVLVNKRPQVPNEYRKRIRQEIYFIGKHGVDSHLKYLLEANSESFLKPLNEISYLQNLIGRVQFVLQIDPKNREFQKYKVDLLRLSALITSPSY